MILKPSKKFQIFNASKIADDIQIGFEYLERMKHYINSNYSDIDFVDSDLRDILDLYEKCSRSIILLSRFVKVRELRKIERMEDLL